MANYDGQGKSRQQETSDTQSMLAIVLGILVFAIAGLALFFAGGE